METHLMIDVEAIGLRAGAAVIEIAAVTFNLDTGETDDEFLVRLKPRAPFTADYETILWHREHGTVIDHEDAIDPVEGVRRFLFWLDLVAPVRLERVLWSWGATYDFPLLEPLLDLRAPGTPEPWRYHQVRDARTIWKTAFHEVRPPARPHTALLDTKAAIRDLVKALHNLRGNAEEASILPNSP